MENDNNNEKTSVINIVEEPTPEVVTVEPTPEVVVQESKPVVAEKPVAKEEVKVDNSFIEKERKVWPFVLLGIILIIGGLFAYYYFVMTKPINVITKVFNGAYKNVEKGTKELDNLGGTEIHSINMDSTVAFTSDDEAFKDLSGLKAIISVGADLVNKDKNIIDADIKLNDMQLMNLAASMADGKVYLDLKDSFSKVVYTESEDAMFDVSGFDSGLDEITKKKDDYLYLIKVVKNAILENISQEKLAKKIMLKDIDGKKVPVVEVTYEIDYLEYKKLHNGVINALLNDDKALESVFGKESVDSVKQKLTSMKDNLSELDFESNINVVLDIEAITSKLVFLSVKDNSAEISYKEKGSEIDISIKSNEDGTIDIAIDENENKIFVDAKMIIEKEVNRFTVTIKVSETSKSEGSSSVSFVMYDPKETNKEVFNVTGDFKVKLNGDIKTVGIDNAVSASELTEKEQQQFMEALNSSMALLDSFDEE